MYISEIPKSIRSTKFLVLLSSSDKLRLDIYDDIKREFRCSRESIFDITDKKQISEVKELSYVDSLMSDRWLITHTVIKNNITIAKELIKIVARSSTMFLIFFVDSYRDFKDLVSELKTEKLTEYTNQLYLNRLNYRDFDFLYNRYTMNDNKLSKSLFDFVYQSYSYSVDDVMTLLTELKQGTKFKSRKEIQDVCGLGGNSVDTFIFSLLKKPPTTEKGLATVLKNRIAAGVDLLESYTLSKFQLYLGYALSSIMDIKVLSISGDIYKKVVALPDGYDSKRLMKYQRYIRQIQDIPMSKILRLRYYLDLKVWTSELDLARFIYGYLYDTMKYEVVPFIEKTSVVDEYIKAKEEEDERARQEKAEEEEFLKHRQISLIKQYGLILGKQKFLEEMKGKSDTKKDDNSDKRAKKKPKLNLVTSSKQREEIKRETITNNTNISEEDAELAQRMSAVAMFGNL